MQKSQNSCPWVLFGLMVTLKILPVFSTLPKSDFSKPSVNVIYREEVYGVNGTSEARAGETCNSMHYDDNIRALKEKTNVKFDEFTKKCADGLKCQLVFDKRGKMIQLSTETFLVTNYELETKDNGAIVYPEITTAIYYMKCYCPKDKFFTYWENGGGKCGAPVDKATGHFCSSSIKIGPLVILIILSSLLLNI